MKLMGASADNDQTFWICVIMRDGVSGAIQPGSATTVPPVGIHYRTKRFETDGATWFVFTITVVRFVAALTLWIFLVIAVVRFVATLALWIIHIYNPRVTTTTAAGTRKQRVNRSKSVVCQQGTTIRMVVCGERGWTNRFLYHLSWKHESQDAIPNIVLLLLQSHLNIVKRLLSINISMSLGGNICQLQE